MKYLIFGAGTIGLTYAYLLAQKHEVDVLVRPQRYEQLADGVSLSVKDLRQADTGYETVHFKPQLVTDIEVDYDGILVAVNRCQLNEALPLLYEKQGHTAYFVFMQNHWNLEEALRPYFGKEQYIVAFPSSIGGGRDDTGVRAIIFNEATRIGGGCPYGLYHLRMGFAQAGIQTRIDQHIFDWLKVHYLQQSVTAGAVLENGNFADFAQNKAAVRKMVKAFREGVAVCRLQGVNTMRTFPANLFRLPLPLVAHVMQKMFLEATTMDMVNNHMKQGWTEWLTGYHEVLQDGLAAGLSMSVWQSYEAAAARD